MQRRERTHSVMIALGLLASHACGDDPEPSAAERECAAYRAALVRYAQCSPGALPPTADPASIVCRSDEERVQRDGGASPVTPLPECTSLLEEHAEPCVELTWGLEPDASTIRRDDQPELRAQLRHCAIDPVADWKRLDAGACELWKHAVDAYRSCDPGVVPDFDAAARCVSDEALGEGRSVLGCADELESRVYPACAVPLGAERERCVTDVLVP